MGYLRLGLRGLGAQKHKGGFCFRKSYSRKNYHPPPIAYNPGLIATRRRFRYLANVRLFTLAVGKNLFLINT